MLYRPVISGHVHKLCTLLSGGITSISSARKTNRKKVNVANGWERFIESSIFHFLPGLSFQLADIVDLFCSGNRHTIFYSTDDGNSSAMKGMTCLVSDLPTYLPVCLPEWRGSECGGGVHRGYQRKGSKR